MSQQQQDNDLTLPGEVKVPMQADESSVEVGYTQADPNKPADESTPLLAGKYKSAEELEKAYKELEAKLGQPKPEDQPTDQKKEEEDIDPSAPKVADIAHTEEAKAALQEKGLDINSFTREFNSTGQLSDDSYAKLEKAGIPRATVDAYINGNRLMVEAQVREVKDSVGGEEVYSRVHQWAATSLNEQEKTAYNRMFETNDLTVCKAAALSLKSRYEAAMGKDPAVVVAGGVGGNNDGVGRFESAAQMVEAMRDPRYSNDPAYRAKVERKVANSNF